MKILATVCFCIMFAFPSLAGQHTQEELTIYNALKRVLNDPGKTCENMKMVSLPGNSLYVVKVLQLDNTIQIADWETKKVVVEYEKKELRIYDIKAGRKLLEILELYLITECELGEGSDDQVG